MESRIDIAARVHEIAPFHVMEVQTAARALEASGRTVIHMEIGEPDFPTPEPVLAFARDAVAHGGIFYTSALGIPELREAIAKHYVECFGVALLDLLAHLLSQIVRADIDRHAKDEDSQPDDGDRKKPDVWDDEEHRYIAVSE